MPKTLFRSPFLSSTSETKLTKSWGPSTKTTTYVAIDEHAGVTEEGTEAIRKFMEKYREKKIHSEPEKYEIESIGFEQENLLPVQKPNYRHIFVGKGATEEEAAFDAMEAAALSKTHVPRSVVDGLYRDDTDPDGRSWTFLLYL
jgi:hypothetical protein